jgi:hypothetical protein
LFNSREVPDSNLGWPPDYMNRLYYIQYLNAVLRVWVKKTDSQRGLLPFWRVEFLVTQETING